MKNLYALATFLIFSIAFGQNPITANFDASYNHRDELLMKQRIKKIKELPNGKILVLSWGDKIALSYNGKKQTEIGSFYMLNSDLTIDTTFKYGVADDNIVDFDLCTDGKIVLVGRFNTYNGVSKKRVVRLLENGEVDLTFNFDLTNVNQYTDLRLVSVRVLPNNSIYISGSNLQFSSGPNITFSIAKLTPTGSVDFSFKCPIISNDSDSFDIQSDGKIVLLTSSYTASPFSSVLKVNRLNLNGSVDATFNTPSAVFGSYNYYQSGSPVSVGNGGYAKIAIHSDNKVYVSGNFTSNNKLLRLNSDGTLDSAFLPFKKIGGDPLLLPFILNSDNTISVILEGSPNSSLTNKISKIDNTGALVSESNAINGVFTSFSKLNNGDYYTSLYWDITLNSTTTRYHMHLKMDSDGNQYYSTAKSTSFAARKIVKLNNNELLQLGPIKNVGEIKYHNGIKKITNNGDLLYNDNLFNPFLQNLQLLETDGNRFLDCKIQSDGKMVLLMQTVNMISSVTYTNYKFIRLNQDFSIDTTFNYDNTDSRVINQVIRTFVILPNDKILFCFNDQLIRLNTNGSIDSQYISNISQVFNGQVNSLCIVEDNKVLVGGSFNTLYNFETGISYDYKGLCCLNQDGEFDYQFVLPLGFDSSVSRVLFKNNKIILYGFINCDEIPDGTLIARFNSNLTLDNAFNYDNELLFDGSVRDVQIQNDNKILLTIYNSSSTKSKLVRISSIGLQDISFNTDNAFDGLIYSVLPLEDGSIMVSGNFNRYNGIWCNGTIKLAGEQSYLIYGVNKLDSNINGCTSADLNYGFLKFNISNGNQYLSNNTENYAFLLGQPGTYTLTPVIENPNYFQISPSSVTVTFPVQGTSLNQDYCITPNGIHPDLEVVLVPVTVARPGFDANYKLVYKNKGNQVQSGSVTLSFNDAVLDYVSGIPAASTTATDIRTWNYFNLKPYETREVIIKLNLNSPVETPPLNGGSVLNYTATITSAQTDDIPNDNTFVLNQTVVNSYDPNDKTCLQGTTVGIDKVGEYVHYVIRFENTGTYTAQNITVKDVIDTDKFDVNTLMPLSGSHLFTTKITEGNKVEFYFENINLPFADATNDGYLAFKIKTKSTLVSGDTFGGLANIFFDYNSAITTNTYTTTIQALSVKDFSFENYFSLYPNPVSDILNIDKKADIEISSIHIYNVMGQLMMVVPNAKNVSTLDVSNLSSGNYFVKINSDKGTSNTKFIKR